MMDPPKKQAACCPFSVQAWEGRLPHSCLLGAETPGRGSKAGMRSRTRKALLPFVPGYLSWAPKSPAHCLARSASLLPPLLLRLPSDQTEGAVWFALFLYMRYPYGLLTSVSVSIGVWVFSPEMPPPSPTMCFRKQVRSCSLVGGDAGVHLCPCSGPQFIVSKTGVCVCVGG